MNFLCKILFFIIFTSSVCIAQINWQVQNSPVNTVLLNCDFTDSLNGWAAGDSGVIIHTSNGGTNWFIQHTPVDYYINDIFFINKRLGWAVSNQFLLDGTTLLKTTNGGVNWAIDSFRDSVDIFRTVYFIDSLTGFIGGFRGAIYKTTDAGFSWNQTLNDTTVFAGFPVSKILFVSDKIGFACGGQIDIVGVIWKTTDSGLSWKADGFSPEPFYDIVNTNSDNLITVGGDFEYGAQISKTSNTGINWSYENLGIFGEARSISFRTSREAWMPLGFAGAWAVTYNSGNTWTSVPSTNNATLYSVDFTDSLHGWAVGTQGTILKYIPSMVSVQSHSTELPSSFILYQNYPNPFNPSTIINYVIPRDASREMQDVKLIIYNSLGKEVQVLFNEKKNAGSYSVNWNASDFPSGIYYYTLTAGSQSGAVNFTDTKKMILLK